METVRVYLSARTPKLLDGKDLLKYLERKFRGTGLQIEPLTMIGSDDPVFGLSGGLWDGKTWPREVRGSILSERIDDLKAHPLVEGIETEAERRAWLGRPIDASNAPEDWDDEPSSLASGPGPIHPVAMIGIVLLVIITSPIQLVSAGINYLRRLYLREFG